MKIAIVGSRGFKDYNLLEEFVLGKVNLTDIEEIISGGAIGADTLAQEFAQKHNLKLNVFLPNWTKYGKSAGVVRNKDIIQNSDTVFAFWDEKSKGTHNIISLSKKLNKTLHIKYMIHDDLELLEFLLLRTTRTGLPVDIFVDDGLSYVRHKHPLWLYFKNGYCDTADVIPVSISNNPKILVQSPVLNISKSDLQKIFSFIVLNKKLIEKLGNDIIQNIEFLKSFISLKMKVK